MPSGIPYIVGNEAAERFSFYGMKAILAVFLTQHLVGIDGAADNLTEEGARATVAWFTAAAYATPFIGAILADRWLGKYRTILWLSLFYCVGHGVLALVDTPLAESIRSRYIIFAGLALIACGSGGIKPCVTSHVGDQFGPSNKGLLTKVYSWFYFSINLGAFSSQLLTPLLLNDERFGPAWAFGVPGVLMAIATLVFWLGRNQFVHVPAAGPSLWSEAFGSEGLRALANLTPLLLFVAMFWSLFDQTAGAWVLQATKMDLTLPVLGWTMKPSQVQAVNPILVLILVPLFATVIYPAVNRFIEVTPLRKIGVGMFVAAFSFVVSAWIEQRIQAGQTPSISWQVLAYFVLTCAEVMISITMLEFFYTQSPRRMKSIVMAFCMLSISIGNVFTALVNTFIRQADGTVLLPGASYYWFFSGLMLLVAIAYTFWAPFYRGQTYLQGEEVTDQRAIDEAH
ncbi:Dipeptide and tripeptide permease A [Planctomycetes bacterium MalM25]|nr:Dipeptide and tripeptide permease A [Planctomycetes bacterium MalM25]